MLGLCAGCGVQAVQGVGFRLCRAQGHEAHRGTRYGLTASPLLGAHAGRQHQEQQHKAQPICHSCSSIVGPNKQSLR